MITTDLDGLYWPQVKNSPQRWTPTWKRLANCSPCHVVFDIKTTMLWIDKSPLLNWLKPCYFGTLGIIATFFFGFQDTKCASVLTPSRDCSASLQPSLPTRRHKKSLLRLQLFNKQACYWWCLNCWDHLHNSTDAWSGQKLPSNCTIILIGDTHASLGVSALTIQSTLSAVPLLLVHPIVSGRFHTPLLTQGTTGLLHRDVRLRGCSVAIWSLFNLTLIRAFTGVN